ncbi:DUF2645 family protein [Burkholderia pseudomallei]|uniref:DUF2645 family protein n=1 Tax=Burkholderia pseudomallei TaxID=28450 RepID=UPI000F08AB95|nr:DUF2645 family protein [Burkholderia pseudomallei]
MGKDDMTSHRRAKIVSCTMIALPILYALACAFLIVLFSERDYEWMIGQREPHRSVLTVCTIPASTDDSSDMAIPALILIAMLFVPGLIHLIRQRRIGLSLLLSLGCLALWAYRFYGRTAFC